MDSGSITASERTISQRLLRSKAQEVRCGFYSFDMLLVMLYYRSGSFDVEVTETNPHGYQVVEAQGREHAARPLDI